MSTLQLSKGGNLNLSKVAPALRNLRVGVAWEANGTDTGKDFDLDVTMFALKNGKTNDAGVLFYNAENRIMDVNSTTIVKGSTLTRQSDGTLPGLPVLPGLAAIHTGDNRTGDAVGDDESITLNLDKLEAQGYDSAVFVNTIHDAELNKQNFGQVRNAVARLYNHDTGEVLASFELGEDFATETAVNLVELYKHNGEWKFKAIGQGYKSGLQAFINQYVV